MELKAILVKIEFFEASFKVHYTKGAKLSYPMPLPTSVAGMFGAMLGWERPSVPDKSKKLLFGSKILSHEGIITEQATYVQYPKNRRGVEMLTVVNEPTYLIAMAGEADCIENNEERLRGEGYSYLPYGGQNDFFLKDVNIIGTKKAEFSKQIDNYAPKDYVERIEFKKGTSLEILPVAHFFDDADYLFYFMKDGKLVLKDGREQVSVEGIGVYGLDKFRWVSG
jgi:CRISPR-associated Cas5-like protein